MSPVAMAQETLPDPAAKPAEEDKDAIVVTGTRRTDRTVAESPVPVDIIGSDQLTSSGLGETNKILNNLVPSFNFPQPSIADGRTSSRGSIHEVVRYVTAAPPR